MLLFARSTAPTRQNDPNRLNSNALIAVATKAKQQQMSGFQEIVPRLYLGNGAVPAAQPRVLQLRGVTHILNVASICACEHRSKAV